MNIMSAVDMPSTSIICVVYMLADSVKLSDAAWVHRCMGTALHMHACRYTIDVMQLQGQSVS